MDLSRNFLTVEKIGKSFPADGGLNTVLDNIDFELPFHDSLAIVGPSGCGKTTLLLMIAGLLSPTAGTIYFQDRPVEGTNKKIALVLQHYGLFPWKTVDSNITLGAKLQKIEVSPDKILEIKKELDIEGLDHLYPSQLSGGQRQRVALARALLLNPLLLLLDEPFAAIDTVTRERLQNKLLTVFAQLRFSFIIVTHNIEEAVFLGKRILVFDNRNNGIAHIFDNIPMGGIDYRNKDDFFRKTTELRRLLEDIQ